jgi:predicted dehydrogenase
MSKTKYAAVGTGGRIPMFIDPIAKTYRDACELVGLCDSSEVRRTYHQQRLIRQYGIEQVPTYADFDQMLREQKPDVVIVCTPDYLHHEFIVKALEAGADVISEKPLTVDAPKCQEIFDAVKRTGRNVRTTFNMRWTPGINKVREVIASGEIGRVKHVDFEYYLNTSHGADYFRRWHSEKECSGGLLLHKSTHHFDVINWWINGIPSRVFAMGDLVFYGKKNATARGETERTTYSRYTGEDAATSDPFRFSLDEDSTLRELYYNAEAESGYIRDRNVFRKGINIEDSMSVMIKYRAGTMVNYSLNAYCPDEGFRASICGDAGRIEYVEKHASHIVTGDQSSLTSGDGHSMHLRVQKHFCEPHETNIPVVEGSHGGGDALIQEQMFSANPPIDSLNRNAGHEQGAASLLIGAAANLSMESGLPVDLDDLVQLPPVAMNLDELI